MEKDAKIFVAGHKGMVGSALMRALQKSGFCNVLVVDKEKIDLRSYSQTELLFNEYRPEYVLLAAAKVGGIEANRQFPGEFIYDNLTIQTNVIHLSKLHGVKKLIFLGSSCIYPRECPQPMREDYLMTGPLEPTNEAYAIAKIAGLKMAQFYGQQYGLQCICAIPCNLYGPNDDFDLQRSHVLAALVRRFVDAVDNRQEEIVLWGTGIARREFLHVDDLARAILLLIDNWHSTEIVNVGSGKDISIEDLAFLVAEKTRYQGSISWDTTKPDGMMKKCLDISKISTLGFNASISLAEGIDEMINVYNLKKLNLQCSGRLR